MNRAMILWERWAVVLLASVLVVVCGCAEPRMSGNPVIEGWYADPDSAVFGDRYWIYPTYSAPYNDQLHFDAFSSPDLVEWTKHERILDSERVEWAWRAMWAPCIAAKDGKYFLFFGANDIQSDDEPGGIGVAVADRPEGPFVDYLGKPLIDRFHNGAQPIDQAVFRDPKDGQWYLYYGGWRHCNVARLNDDFTGFVPFEDGTVFKEITPDGYVEGPTMLFRGGKYYFMWSEGGWTGPDYRVAYAVADSPLGPFERVGVILAQDPEVATGAGHHSVMRVGSSGGEDEWVIVYHRRPLGETDRNHRVVCVDRLEFGADGLIVPVRIGFEGVEAQPVRPEFAQVQSYERSIVRDQMMLDAYEEGENRRFDAVADAVSFFRERLGAPHIYEGPERIEYSWYGPFYVLLVRARDGENPVYTWLDSNCAGQNLHWDLTE